VLEGKQKELVKIMIIAKKKIVVADDEQIILTTLTILLDERYSVYTAVNGSEAVALTEKEAPDLVIMDIVMPVMDGYQACRRLKAERKTSAIPVLMLTAKDGLDSVLEGFNAGADSYMIKPFTTAMLLAKIKDMIQHADFLKGIS
jgi:DNA-binding response OmpR family regulator